MTLLEKMNENPTFINFHDCALLKFDIQDDYVCVHIEVGEYTYYLYEEELKGVYIDPENKMLYIEQKFYGVKDMTGDCPPNIGPQDYFSIYSNKIENGKMVFSYENERVHGGCYQTAFSFDRCETKILCEMAHE